MIQNTCLELNVTWYISNKSLLTVVPYYNQYVRSRTQQRSRFDIEFPSEQHQWFAILVGSRSHCFQSRHSTASHYCWFKGTHFCSRKLYSSNSSFKSCKLALIIAIACDRLLAYLENKSCWRPDQTSTLVPSIWADTVTRMGYLSTRFATILAPGKTDLTQDSAVEYSW